MNRLSFLLKEPLCHFAVAGGLLFIVYLFIGNQSEGSIEDSQAGSIVVGPREVNHLKATWKQLWSREPDKKELSRLVEDFIREEALYREAIALELDQDDMIVRRRMAQKMAFLSNNSGAEPPAGQTLAAWFSENKEVYRLPASVSFSHIYFGSEQRGEQAASDAQTLLDSLNAEENPPQRAPDRGDRFITRYDYVNIGPEDLANLFGKEFSSRVFEFEANMWAGPVPSAYGHHLVFITEKADSRIPELEEIRTRVEVDWMQELARAANRKMVDELIAKYGLEIDPDVKSQLNADIFTGSDTQ